MVRDACVAGSPEDRLPGVRDAKTVASGNDAQSQGGRANAVRASEIAKGVIVPASFPYSGASALQPRHLAATLQLHLARGTIRVCRCDGRSP